MFWKVMIPLKDAHNRIVDWGKVDLIYTDDYDHPHYPNNAALKRALRIARDKYGIEADVREAN